MKKQLVSATKTYQPSYPDELLVDDKANVGSYNLITSDAVARAVAGASGEVPQVTESDNGKVLTAVYDEGGAAVEWAESQGGNVDQTYNSASTNAQSGTAVAGALATVDEVPDVTSTDNGKVLKAAYSEGAGSYSWQAEPGILDLVAGTGISITEGTNDLTIAADVLPAYDTTTDAGRVLQVTANGLAWVALS